ncbi:MAG TPA: glycosyltransferase, partial [Arcobacter sp.]|nr:glycosyltransferase [Arcobacter sp.]
MNKLFTILTTNEPILLYNYFHLIGRVMKILMYAQSIGTVTETFVNQDAVRLSKNHELIYVCDTIADSGMYTLYDKITVIESDRLSIMKRILLKLDISMNLYNKQFSTHLNDIIDNFKPDIIHCQFGIQALKLIDNLENNDIPLVIQFRGHDASDLLNRKAYVKRLQEVLSKENYYSIFVAESLRNNLKKHHINTKRSMILHSGIDLSKFVVEKEKSHDTFTFLQVSSLDERKGILYTLKAFAKFLSTQNSKNFKLILTGDGERKELLINLTKSLNIENYVEFVGFVSPAQAKELMQNADVFVHHSITTDDGNQEGIPNAIMEAMAMELPVLSSYHSGIPELVTNGVNGYLVKERDVDAYAESMQNILSWGRMKENRDVIANEFEI